MKFENLIEQLLQTQQTFQAYAVRTVNTALTLRNWLFGYYMVEFEQHGEERAKYGEHLIRDIAKQLKQKGLQGLSFTNLNLYRQFYKTYPQISQSMPEQFKLSQIIQSLPEQFAQQTEEVILTIPPERLLNQLTFTHFVELVKIDEPLKRLFYELECLKGNWNVRELKRQIGSLLYERTGLSRNKDKLMQLTQSQATTLVSSDIIRDPYVFEFLGLKDREVYQESDLENALMSHLQQFLLELGRGFCFEGRQKRLTVDNEHYYVDLVFYHRVLKCHVLIELKNRKFNHSDAGQLNFYLNYFKKCEMTEGDNPPVGILLGTARDAEHVEFATAGLDNQIFVSKYKVALPTEAELKEFIERELRRGNL